MSFRIRGLDPAPFQRFFAMRDDELADHGAARRVADSVPGYPCRVSLEDAAIGEELLLVAFEHHAAASPYRASGPIYVRRSAERVFDRADVVPPALAGRLLSIRAYDRGGMMRASDVSPGSALTDVIERFFAGPAIGYLHVHNAKPGCFACRVDRA